MDFITHSTAPAVESSTCSDRRLNPATKRKTAWERGEHPLAGNTEALIRLHAAEQLGIKIEASVQELSASCVASANKVEIEIDGSNPKNYRSLALAA